MMTWGSWQVITGIVQMLELRRTIPKWLANATIRWTAKQ